MDDKQDIKGLVASIEAKRETWALEEKAAGDYERLECGFLLYKPTLPHVWALAKAAHMLEGDSYGLPVDSTRGTSSPRTWGCFQSGG